MSIAGLEPLSADERLGVDLAKSEYGLIRQLVALRTAAGIKPAELARRLDVDKSVISRFESGGTNPTMATVNRYAEAIGAMITYEVEPHHVWHDKKRVRDLVERTLTLFVDDQSGLDVPAFSHQQVGAKRSHHSTEWTIEVAPAP